MLCKDIQTSSNLCKDKETSIFKSENHYEVKGKTGNLVIYQVSFYDTKS